MKELIEKIKEISTKYKSYTSNEIIIYASNRGVVKGVELCINEIQGQESKPFNPLELGFKKEFESDRESVFYKTMNNRIIFDKTKDIYLIDVYKFNIYSEVKNIRIPNHRQGVELLRNLGVIE